MIEGWILAPSACNVAEIALPEYLSRNASAASEGLNRNIVKALALCLRSSAKSGVDDVGNIADRVLHAYIVGNAYTLCKQKERT